jgi:hypothetical protein
MTEQDLHDYNKWITEVWSKQHSNIPFMIDAPKAYLKYRAKQLTIPVFMWRFCAYKTKKKYESGEHYFVKDFLDHAEMKVFSGEHSAKEKPLYPDYCSMYWKIETNAP